MRRRARFGLCAAVLGAIAVGLLLRSVDIAHVFPYDGSVRLGVDDSWFHARRALYSFVHFPHVLQFDWYLNYPRGAGAPCPPLFDWAIAAVARLFGHAPHTLEVVAAWFSPVLAALLALPAFWIGRSVAGPWVGLAASWLVAVLPSGILVTRLGNCDTPAAVAIIAGCWLASSLREIGRSGRSLALHTFLHGAIVATLLLTWSGSLLYLGIAEGARLATVVFLDGRPQRYFAVAASLALAAIPVLGWLLVSLPPLGGPFTSQTLSWLHLVALLCIAALAAGLGELERRRPDARPAARAVRAMVVAAVLAIPALMAPAIRHALLHGIDFLGKKDLWAATNPEQAPLFNSLPSRLVRHATTRFGFFAYLVPLTPLVVAAHLIRSRGARKQRLLVLLFWVTALCGLVLYQVRYGTDFTVPGAVVFVLALADLRSLLLRWIPQRAATAAVVVLAILLMGPAWRWDAAMFEGASARRREEARPGALQAVDNTGIFFLFAREVRRLTPKTRGFLNPADRPEYGLLVPPALGHIFTYVARRPVPADNLGPYLDVHSFIEASNFYRTRSASEGVHLLEDLGVRYVVTMARGGPLRSFSDALHFTYASAGRDGPTSGRLRLVAQGPVGNTAVILFTSRTFPHRFPPFELFEFVKGAVLVARTEPNAPVVAHIALNTVAPMQGYTAAARADSSGVARLRVPYPSADGTGAPPPPGVVRSKGDWIVQTSGRSARVVVSEADVSEGHEVPVHWQPERE